MVSVPLTELSHNLMMTSRLSDPAVFLDGSARMVFSPNMREQNRSKGHRFRYEFRSADEVGAPQLASQAASTIPGT